MQFYIVDVFAGSKYSGNQLAVFTDAGNLTDGEMMNITREINFAESTFITACDPVTKTYTVRIFTPEYEVPFAGHPTIGTAGIILQEFLKGYTGEITLDLKVGKIPVYADSDQFYWLIQSDPAFGLTCKPELIAPFLGIPVDAIEHHYPVQLVNTGLGYIIVHLKELDTFKNLSLCNGSFIKWAIKNKLHKSTSNDGLTAALYLVCRNTVHPENQYHARMFSIENERFKEDAATGSANACFAAYLAHYDLFPESKSYIQVEQGYEMGRPSLLRISGLRTGNRYHLKVGGQIHKIASGNWV